MTLEERFVEFLQEDCPCGVDSALLSVLRTAFMKGVAIALYDAISPKTSEEISLKVQEMTLELCQFWKSQKKL